MSGGHGTLDDLAAVRSLVETYVAGANGDAERLRRAFHPTATMAGHVGDLEEYVPIEEFISYVADHPGLAGPEYRTAIRSIDLVGDAGVAVLVEHDYMGCDFVNFFTVARVQGRWFITNKTYAHTGGELALPAD